MAKVKTFKTIFPAVSVPLNDDYSINEPEFRAYLRWIKSFYGKGIEGLVCNGLIDEVKKLLRQVTLQHIQYTVDSLQQPV